ncbi:unnamed protein product [Ambrosiozyma monospora]|uniref:General negative regulator of transcription subunit n=1 Tax=Ambrosiozyma monospora TaxID=43982 RepID=A0A9W7DE02_AMBMO|nr:unnamed protein product [Ambrosiozyma monospora]
MSQRKLQQEIDRVFKKVKEGLDEFDYVYDKLQDCDNQSQKDKLENDLKKEIKKLQRFREQIKNWLSGNDVKDKKQLLEHRRLIEHEMERFKEVEKMVKTKAFSNEALASGEVRVHPRQKEKDDCIEFLQSQIEELERQDESLEAEADQIQATMKRKKSDSIKQAHIDELNEKSERHRFHIERLETVLRLLENDNLDIDQVNGIREDIEYYVDSNEDDNFVEDETFYDELGLDDIDEDHKVIPQETKPDTTFDDDVPYVPAVLATSVNKDKDKRDRKLSSASSRKVSTSRPSTSTNNNQSNDSHPPTAAQTLASQLSHSQHNSPKPKNATLITSQPVTSSLLNGGLKPATPAATPKLRYASVVSAAVHANNNNNDEKSAVPSPVPSPAQLATTPSSTHAQLHESKSTTSTVGLSRTTTFTSSRDQQFSKDDNSTPLSISFLDSSLYSNLPKGFNEYMKALESAKERIIAPHDSSKDEPVASNGKKQKEPQQQHPWFDLKLPDLDTIYPQLESSLLNCPDSYDADKPKTYRPTNQFATQPSFPLEPAVDIIGSTRLMGKLEVDTLAYCFYYHNLKYKSQFTNLNNLQESKDSSDYLQYITAKEMNKRGWKYHKDLHIWCHPEENDKVPAAPIGVDGNVNTWKYFDYQDTWMVRRKDNFVFDETLNESF